MTLLLRDQGLCTTHDKAEVLKRTKGAALSHRKSVAPKSHAKKVNAPCWTAAACLQTFHGHISNWFVEQVCDRVEH